MRLNNRALAREIQHRQNRGHRTPGCHPQLHPVRIRKGFRILCLCLDRTLFTALQTSIPSSTFSSMSDKISWYVVSFWISWICSRNVPNESKKSFLIAQTVLVKAFSLALSSALSSLRYFSNFSFLDCWLASTASSYHPR